MAFEFENGDMRVWWIPQIPGKPFHVPVASILEAKLILQTLADYDLFQREHRIKPDYANAGGLQVYDTECPDEEGDCWIEWTNEDGEGIDEVDGTGKGFTA